MATLDRNQQGLEGVVGCAVVPKTNLRAIPREADAARIPAAIRNKIPTVGHVNRFGARADRSYPGVHLPVQITDIRSKLSIRRDRSPEFVAPRVFGQRRP